MRYFVYVFIFKIWAVSLHRLRNFIARVQVIPQYVSSVTELYFLAYFLNIIVWNTYGNALNLCKRCYTHLRPLWSKFSFFQCNLRFWKTKQWCRSCSFIVLFTSHEVTKLFCLTKSSHIAKGKVSLISWQTVYFCWATIARLTLYFKKA